MTWNRLAGTLCICFLALVNTHCGRDIQGNVAESPTLTIHVPDQDERLLGPNGANPWFLVFLGLTIDPKGSGTPEPRLLDRWEHTPDYTEWTLHVREGLQWDDGMPVTAEDVKFSLGLWTDPNIGYEYSFYDEITVLDSHTLRVVFKEPVRGKIFVYDWLAMLPRHLLEPLDRDRIFSWPFWIQPVGNGPYRYVRHVPSVMTELEANPQFYGDAPGVSRVVLRFGGSGLTELLSGKADIASRLTPVQAEQLAADPRFRLYHTVQYGHHIAIVWNHRSALFSDAEVRRALTMALDRRELNRILNYPEDLPIFDVPITKRHHLQGVIPDPLPFSPERSAELLERAGWIDADNDGIREKDGRAFEFTLSTTEKTMGEAVFIQEQLRQVGVHMEISTYERQTLKHRLQSSHDFDAAIQKYNYIENFDESPDSGYSNPEVIRIRDFVWFTIDQEAADEQMLELWRIFEEEVPVTYLHPTLSYLGAHRRVRGLRNDEDLFLLVEQLSIEE